MDILLEKLGRRYNRQWIFSNLSIGFHSPGSYAILGPNGSGKSTLLQILSGNLSPSEGKIEFREPEGVLSIEKVYQKISYSAPYLEIPQEFTVNEFFDFHFGLKGLHPMVRLDKILEDSGIQSQKKKRIKDLSTGVQQRVKLISAFGSNSQVVILDEPTANLDESGKNWFIQTFKELSPSRLFFMGSNIPSEFEICENQLNISDFKTRNQA